MIIHRLEIEGFKRIGKLLKLQFPDNGRTIAISGVNEAGKSSLFQSIEFGFYGLKQGTGMNREDITTWGKQRTKVVIEFTAKDQRFIIERQLDGSKHTVKLIPVVNGVHESSNTITGISSTETRIEELFGLDRESFTKVLYMRQKDLDALKGLFLAKRELLLNKIIAIELFDVAKEKIKFDSDKIEDELEKKKNLMQNRVEPTKKSYEEKNKTLLKKNSEIEELEDELLDSAKDLQDLKSLIELNEWKSKYYSSKKLDESFSNAMNHIENQKKKLERKAVQLELYKNVISEYEPELQKLDGLCETYQTIENKLGYEYKDLDDLHQEKSLIEKKFSKKDRKIIENNYGEGKTVQRKHLFIFLIFGVVSLLFFFIINHWILITGSLILFSLFIFLFVRYLKTINLVVRSADLRSILKQISERNVNIEQYEKEKKTLVLNNAFDSSGNIQEREAQIISIIKLKTGVDSIQSLESLRALVDSLEEEIGKLRSEDYETQLSNIRNELGKIHDTLKILDGSRPHGTDDSPYDEDYHHRIAENFRQLSEEFNDTKISLKTSKEIRTLISSQMEDLHEDYLRYSSLYEEIKREQNELMVLEGIRKEYDETAKDLRRTVIPYITMFISNILPKLTNGRYSNFQITEDLQFKAYSAEAGVYKEREIFSGGTQDQFLIALRLAFTHSILNSRSYSDQYCLLMDECISSSDDGRKEGIFSVLNDEHSIFSQIFVIAHENVELLVHHNIQLGNDENGYTIVQSKSW